MAPPGWSRALLACIAAAMSLHAPPSRGSEQRILGIDYAGAPIKPLERLRREDLLGALKMSGTWVSKLPPGRFDRIAGEFCKFAMDRGQDFYLQIPVTWPNGDIASSLDSLVARGCAVKAFSIGNEVDRLVTEKIVARYALADYVRDYNRVVPLVAKRFPRARIVALELSAFTILDWTSTNRVEARYRPVFEWVIPFSKARLVRRPDYVSVHFYPFTGAQKEWETLSAAKMLHEFLGDLAPHLQGVPPLLIGEFNTTYQYENDMVYAGSGGDSFMAALVAPELLANEHVAGFFHWSLAEPPPSLLGLFQGPRLEPMPLFHAYRMIADVLDHQSAMAATKKRDLEAYGYRKDGRYRLLVVNANPFFRRGLSVSPREDADIRAEGFDETVTLLPLSLTELGSGAPARAYAYAERKMVSDTDYSSKRYCAPIADFSQRIYAGEHFENRRFNQNTKIHTGGTFVAVASPGARATLRRSAGVLGVDCALPAGNARYYQCGVKLPFTPDSMMDKRMGVDWTAGYEKGSLRLTLEAAPPTSMQVYLEDFRAEDTGFNQHRSSVRVEGRQVFEMPLREFGQEPGFGTAVPVQQVLANLADLRIETREAGYRGQLRVFRVEVCDQP